MTQESTNTTADWQSEAMHQNKLLHEMTDEELITYLRFQGLDKDIAAASRIEKLAAQLKTVLEREAETQARHDSKMDALEAKLAKAGEALTSIAVNTCCGGCQEAALVARAALSREGGEW